MTISSNITNQSNPKVIDFIQELETIAWFENVGQHIYNPEIKQLFSWSDAWESLQNENWINASFHNDIDNMNPVWDIAYDKALEVVSKSSFCHEFEDGISIADAVAYDVATAAVEVVNQNKNGFFIDLMKWYCLGHFPCGWEGKYPLGKLIVY